MLPEKVDKVARKRNALKKQQEEEESDTALVQHDHSLKVQDEYDVSSVSLFFSLL